MDRTPQDQIRGPMSAEQTYGLTHIALSVRDADRSFRFYQRLLGARLLSSHQGMEDDDLSDQEWLEFGIPGARDVITLRKSGGEVTGATGDLAHFGFRLRSPAEPDALVAAVEKAGGTVLKAGRFPSGDPFIFAHDPDGYEVELWYESDDGWRA